MMLNVFVLNGFCPLVEGAREWLIHSLSKNHTAGILIILLLGEEILHILHFKTCLQRNL